MVILTSASLAGTASAQALTVQSVSVDALTAQASRAASATAAQVRLRAWHYALAQRGKPYIWGATGPTGFDCSGLVYAAYRAAGIVLPRTTYEMLGSWRLIRISKSEAQQGDLAFFGTGHVELYDSGSWTFGAQKTGTLIGLHLMNAFWHPTMYFRVRVLSPPEHPLPESPAAEKPQPVTARQRRCGVVYAPSCVAGQQAITGAVTEAVLAMAGSGHVFRT